MECFQQDCKNLHLKNFDRIKELEQIVNENTKSILNLTERIADLE